MARASVLAIFIFVCISGCTQSVRDEIPVDIEIQYSQDRPVSVTIPNSFLPDGKINAEELRIQLSGAATSQSILGEVELEEQFLIFTPVIPFRREITYLVKYREQELGRFSIQREENQSVPEIAHIYPTTDTVPENLLKIHLEFSERMSEIHSSNYVSLLNARGDTLDHIFLKLDPKLWNYDQTMLTLWLEPGRIKKSLLPNVLDGIPIEQGNIYTIAVSDDWKSAEGVPLAKSVSKTIYVSSRDESMPSVSNWRLESPKGSSQDPLRIFFEEVLDCTSLLGSFIILNKNEEEIPGTYRIMQGETGLEFFPDHPWTAGKYVIEIDGSIEDLAANNLNRLFDRDLETDSSEIVESDKALTFEVSEV